MYSLSFIYKNSFEKQIISQGMDQEKKNRATKKLVSWEKHNIM